MISSTALLQSQWLNQAVQLSVIIDGGRLVFCVFVPLKTTSNASTGTVYWNTVFPRLMEFNHLICLCKIAATGSRMFSAQTVPRRRVTRWTVTGGGEGGGGGPTEQRIHPRHLRPDSRLHTSITNSIEISHSSGPGSWLWWLVRELIDTSAPLPQDHQASELHAASESLPPLGYAELYSTTVSWDPQTGGGYTNNRELDQ